MDFEGDWFTDTIHTTAAGPDEACTSRHIPGDGDAIAEGTVVRSPADNAVAANSGRRARRRDTDAQAFPKG